MSKGNEQGNISIPVEKTSERNVVNGFKEYGLFPPDKKSVQHRILTIESNDFSEAGSSILSSSNITVDLTMLPDISTPSKPGSNQMQSPYKDLN